MLRSESEEEPAPLDDAALFLRWCQGETSAGEQLVARHYRAVYRFFRNKAANDVDDLTQRTFLACTESRARFEQRASFRSYLFGVARLVLFEHFRRRKRDQVIDFGLSTVEGLDPTPSQHLAASDEQRRLLSALRRLPVDLQVALELFYWENLSTREMADALEVPQGTVTRRLQRGRAALERELLRLDEPRDTQQAAARARRLREQPS